jgi:hypothetical protein
MTFFILLIMVFIFIRLLFGVWENIVNADKAHAELFMAETGKEMDEAAGWYFDSSVEDFVFNPFRWNIWTPAQYEKFLKGRRSKEKL